MMLANIAVKRDRGENKDLPATADLLAPFYEDCFVVEAIRKGQRTLLAGEGQSAVPRTGGKAELLAADISKT